MLNKPLYFDFLKNIYNVIPVKTGIQGF